jgi:hypothetical protein
MFEDSALAGHRPVLWIDACSIADRVDGGHVEKVAFATSGKPTGD